MRASHRLWSAPSPLTGLKRELGVEEDPCERDWHHQLTDDSVAAGNSRGSEPNADGN